MPISLADLEAKFNINLDPLKAAIAEGLQKIHDLTAAIKQEAAEHAAATGARNAAAASERQFSSEAEKMTVILQRGLSVEAAETEIRKQMAATTDKAAISLRQFGTAASQAGRALSVGLSAPLLAAGGLALKSSQDIQRAMNTIRADTGATGERLNMLGASFRSVASQVPQDMEAVGKAVALVAVRTGASGEALTNLSKQFLTLSRVTNSDLNPLITQSTKVFAQWGVTVGQQGEALNQFLRAHEATGIGVQELTDRLLAFGPAAKAVGLSLTDTEALLGAFNKQGENAQKLTFAMNTLFAKWAKEGITDAHAALANLITGIQKAPSQFAALQVAMQAGMAGRGGQEFVNAVRTGGFEFQKFLDIILQGKDTIAKAGQDTLTVAQQFDTLKNKISLAAQPLGDFIAQKLKDLSSRLDDDMPKIKAFGDAFAHQSDALKNTEFGLAGIAGAAGPALYALGRLAIGWSGLTTVMKAGTGVARGFFSAEVFTAALPIAALLAVGAVILAIGTDFDGVREKFASGARVIAETFQNLADSVVHFFSNAWDSVLQGFSGLGDRLKSDWSKLGRDAGGAYGSAFDAEANRLLEQQKQQTVQAAPGSNLQAAFSDIVPIPLAGPPAGAAPRPLRSAGSFRGSGPPPNLKAETDAHREMREALMAESKAQEVLNLMKEGYNKHQAELIARYGPATAAVMKHTEALDAQAEKIQKAIDGQQHYKTALAEVEQKIREVQSGATAKAAVGSDFGPRVNPAQIKFLEEKKQRLADLSKPQAALVGLGKQLDAALSSDSATMAAFSGETKKEVSAEELLNKAIATGMPDLIAKAEAHLGNAAAIGAHRDAVKALTQEFNQQKGVMDAILAVELHQQEIAVQLGGSGKQLTEVQKALNLAYESGDPFLISWAEDLAKVAAAQDKDLAQKKAVESLTTKINAGLTHAQEVIDSYGAAISLTEKAQTDLNAAMKLGDPAAITLAQQYLAAAQAADALTAAHKENVKEQSTFQQALKKTADFFQSEFTKGFEGFFKTGLKNFFPQLLADLDSLLQQMAAKILSANLTSLLFGSVTGPGAGGAASPASSAGGGLLGGLIGAIGGIFGGSGGGVGDITGGLGIGPSTLTSADLAGLAGAQSGGYLLANQPRLVGESGPEAFIPAQSGSLIPNHALTQSVASGATRRGGGSTTVHFHISTPDVSGFKKSQPQLMADAHRLGEASRIRNGG